jgi:hypothetical protein
LAFVVVLFFFFFFFFFFFLQTRTFTKWLNATLRQHLGKSAPVITQLPRAFRDGIILFKLAAALYPHAEQPNYNKAPKMRPQAIDNVSMALKLIEKYGPELRFTQVEQLVDCDPKMTLGMVWSIVHHHQIRAIQVGALHGKDGLLLWCKRIAQPLGVEIANFTTSWRDGAAFACIVSTLVGDDKLPLAPMLDQRVTAPRATISRATFAVAEQELGVPQLISPEDLLDIERPDEKSILTYVSELFRVGASRTTHSTAFEPEDGGAVLAGILTWQKSESERRPSPAMAIARRATSSAGARSRSSARPMCCAGPTTCVRRWTPPLR